MEDLLGLLLGFVPCGWGDEVRDEAELTIAWILGDRQRYKRHHTAEHNTKHRRPPQLVLCPTVDVVVASR